MPTCFVNGSTGEWARRANPSASIFLPSCRTLWVSLIAGTWSRRLPELPARNRHFCHTARSRVTEVAEGDVARSLCAGRTCRSTLQTEHRRTRRISAVLVEREQSAAHRTVATHGGCGSQRSIGTPSRALEGSPNLLSCLVGRRQESLCRPSRVNHTESGPSQGAKPCLRSPGSLPQRVLLSTREGYEHPSHSATGDGAD